MNNQDSACKRVGVTVLGSGSKGNATLVHCGNDAIMVDAGFTLKETGRRIKSIGLDGLEIHGILVTHEHEDHIKGVRLCSEQYGAPIYATRKCADVLRYRDEKIRQMVTFAPGGSFQIGSFTICPFTIPHDANDPVAFVIYCNNVKIAVATDIGYVSSVVEYELHSCDTLVIESNHDLNMLAASSRPWSLKQRIMGRHGHLSNDASQQLLEKIVDEHTKHVILAHLSNECNKLELAEQGAHDMLDSIGRKDVSLDVALQDAPLSTVWS